MKKGEIAKKIILAVASTQEAGGLTLTLTNIPGIAVAIKPFIYWYKNQDKFGRYRIRKTFSKLREQNLIEAVKDNNDAIKFILTETGKKTSLLYRIDDLKIEQPKKWDKKWRMVFFDIPETHKKIRHLFRAKLQELGFYQLQKSVWLYPHDCRQEINFITETLNIKHCVKLLEINRFEDDEKIKEKFKI